MKHRVHVADHFISLAALNYLVRKIFVLWIEPSPATRNRPTE